MSFFKQFPEFIDYDSRKDRGFSPVTAETLDNRHHISLPSWVVEDQTILDLGSCLGASGHWCLSLGAKHYTGVEVQPKLVEKSKEILSKYWNKEKFEIVEQDLREFLKNEISKNKKYDVVVLIGVIYAFLDIYGLLEQVEKICDYCIVIDSIYPWSMINPDVSIIDVTKVQHINGSDEKQAFYGAGSRPSPAALRILLETLGFEDKEGLLYPDPLKDKNIHDTYNSPIIRSGTRSCPMPARYLLRFYKTKSSKLKMVVDNVVSNNLKKTTLMADAPQMISSTGWAFDDSVAQRFQKEAETHIPDYNRVINLCIDYTKEIFLENKDIKIVDVGSALGFTIDKFIEAGYLNVSGIDNSRSMINQSKHSQLIKFSDSFIKDQYDVILANWTLHFIKNREQYIKEMIESLNTGGLIIISDKMEHSVETENLYYNFKRNNGVPEEVIQKKKLSLNGILVTKPLTWYINVLKNLGLSDIQVINSRFMFSTIYARKL